MARRPVFFDGPDGLLVIQIGDNYYVIPDPDQFRRTMTTEVFDKLSEAYRDQVGRAVLIKEIQYRGDGT